MDKPRILFSIPSRSHIGIAVDEMEGMRSKGYAAAPFAFGGKEKITTPPGRLMLILANAIQLLRKAFHFRPDVIYFNSRLEVLGAIRDALTIFLFKTFYPRKVHFLIKSHGSDLEVLANKSFIIRNLALPYLKKNVAGWLFLSSYEQQEVLKTGYFKAETLFTTKNIVRTGQFKKDKDFKNSLGIPEGHSILLFTGRIIREKGIFEVLDAFARIRKIYNVKLIIVGDGNDYDTLKEKIRDAGLNADTVLTGFIPEAEVITYYANSDVLVFPTFFPEGFPMSLFNSVAAGLSVITTPVRAAADYLSAPENCLWVEQENSESVFNALDKLLASEKFMESMKKNNLIKAQCFTQEKVCHELELIVNKILL